MNVESRPKAALGRSVGQADDDTDVTSNVWSFNRQCRERGLRWIARIREDMAKGGDR